MSRARAPNARATPSAISPMRTSMACMTSVESARTVPESRAVCGMTL